MSNENFDDSSASIYSTRANDQDAQLERDGSFYVVPLEVEPLVVEEVTNERDATTSSSTSTSTISQSFSLYAPPKRHWKRIKMILAWSMLPILSGILAVIVSSPQGSNHHAKASSPTTTIPLSQQSSCEENLDISFHDLKERISKDRYTWCAPKTKDGKHCTCTSPVVPLMGPSEPWWNSTHSRNVKQAQKQQGGDGDGNAGVSIVGLGDSIMERWSGTVMGTPLSNRDEYVKVYDELFRSSGRGDRHQRSRDGISNKNMEGMMLGIAGDQCPQLLYRILNGEIPQSSSSAGSGSDGNHHPNQIFWLLIGTNDLDRGGCSKEAVLIGIINIVDNIRNIRPDSIIVVNAILPRHDFQYNDEISWINQRLRCYATRMDHHDSPKAAAPAAAAAVSKIHFFNATKLFLNDQGTNVKESLMPDGVHPSVQGYRVWGQRIVDRAIYLLPRLSISLNNV